MSTAAKEDTVWIGFMDIVPVIGTVKEAVELVLAVYEENKAVIKESEKALENIIKGSLKKHVNLTLPASAATAEEAVDELAAAARPTGQGLVALGVKAVGAIAGLGIGPALALEVLGANIAAFAKKPAAGAAEVYELAAADEAEASAYSGLRNVREVRMEMVIEYVLQGSKGRLKFLTSAEQEKRKKRVEAIQKDMLRKIHIIDPQFNNELEEELNRSKRGEHLFNNNILKFHSKVLTDFVRINNVKSLRGYNQQAIDELDGHTLSSNTATEIQTNMVVVFDEYEFYVNANGVLYGVYCSFLHSALLDVLRCINPLEVTEKKIDWVNFVIDNMNHYEIYVDHLAKAKWIDNNVKRWARFKNVKQEVAHMYKTVRGIDWCLRILNEVAPLFNQGQQASFMKQF